MVADAVIYHPTVSHWLKFTATTVGRDKLMRTVQYFARFYAWYLYRLNGSPAEVAPWTALKNVFSLIRKALRLGKPVEHLKAAAQAYDARPNPLSSVSGATPQASTEGTPKMDPILRYLAIGRQLGYAGYLTLDNIHFFHHAGIVKYEALTAKRLQENAYKLWFAGIVNNVVAGGYQLYQLRRREGNLNLKDGDDVVESRRIDRERKAVNMQLICDLCDMTIPIYFLGMVSDRFLDDGLVGLLGTTSSLIGLWGVWSRT